MLGNFVRVVTVETCCLVALAILALSSEPMLQNLWFLWKFYVTLVPIDPSVEAKL
jgi:hypothetical protein